MGFFFFNRADAVTWDNHRLLLQDPHFSSSSSRVSDVSVQDASEKKISYVVCHLRYDSLIRRAF